MSRNRLAAHSEGNQVRCNHYSLSWNGECKRVKNRGNLGEINTNYPIIIPSSILENMILFLVQHIFHTNEHYDYILYMTTVYQLLFWLDNSKTKIIQLKFETYPIWEHGGTCEAKGLFCMYPERKFCSVNFVVVVVHTHVGKLGSTTLWEVWVSRLLHS